MRYQRKIIRIKGSDSPNVRLALSQIARGEEPTGEALVPGVLTWEEYQTRLKLLPEDERMVSLDAEFYQGQKVFLFPKDVLDLSLKVGSITTNRRRALAMGVDSAEGGDDTVWTVTDMSGILFQYATKTADTADVPGVTIGLIKDYRLTPQQVLFDRGGGGKQHADQLRRKGFDVRTVGFGEGATDPHKDRKTATVKSPVHERVYQSDVKYAYKNRRAEMYHLTAQLFAREEGFGIPAQYAETARQLKVVPKQWDGEGRLWLPPKDKPHANYTGVTLCSVLGRSPDHADSLVLACWGMLRKPPKVRIGSL